MKKTELTAKISELEALVADMREILDGSDADAPLAFLEVCQDIQGAAGRILHAAMLSVLNSADERSKYTTPDHPDFGH